MPIYINPYTDFGFKKLFGEEANKSLLIDFLNQLLPERHQIAQLDFRNTEIIPDTGEERKAIFDIHCIAQTGERFVVEMQKAKVKFFKDRALFYSTFPIREQAEKGEWNFNLKAVYFVAVLDFLYDEEEERAKFRRDVCLKDQDNEDFFDKLDFKFLQMPAFKKQEHELVTHFDKWVYLLKNLESFETIPKILKEPVFEKAFEVAKVANYSQKQREAYEMSRLDYIGAREMVITAQEDGMEKGMKEGLKEGLKKGMEKGMEKRDAEIVKAFILEGSTFAFISKITGLSIEKIQKIADELDK